MTIRGIRRLQNLCRGGLIVAVLMMPAPLLEDPAAARWMLLVMLAALVVSGVCALVVARLRCPVCRHVFVGRGEYRDLFTRNGRNCGRRSGDTS